ncbi:hypothetical protein N657DRAFT_637215 [Parathielavia appendiculata]|uniref:Heterokaryon incompatibility domain-containing protein n=1 Tax=Parathielavia appendiculata TaxID=2587402 RepID=A0AAN6TSX5_9PEZI|nr:hypothetical protein N657DRAFT_637215 [Parathielavia appendiculata]
MSRWHKPDRSTPDIFVGHSTRTPACLTCGAASDLDEIIRQQSHASPLPTPPPDQPQGKMSLCPTVSPHPDLPDWNLTQNPPSTPRLSDQASSALACIEAIPVPNTGPDYPVHVILETYALSNCLPYETVSYCWAGEEGDGTPDGIRSTWGKDRSSCPHGRIYASCTQVVVYLGLDVAPVLPEGRYLRRAKLRKFGSKDIEQASGVRGVKELLQGRYFSRLWVVQELILSPQVVIRIGEVDIQADGTTTGNQWGSEPGSLAP